MIRFLKQREAGRAPATTMILGHLETTVMDLLWEHGESNVHDVVQGLSRPLAYTTVMTTLDRLFKKGLLNRRKSERAFIYSPRFSRKEWEQKRAGDLVAGFLDGAQPSSELLISCLVEAIGQHDEALLDQLERKIRMQRRQLMRDSRAAGDDVAEPSGSTPRPGASELSERRRKP